MVKHFIIRMLYYPLIILFTGLLCGCSDNTIDFTENTSDPAKLIDGIDSYQSISDFTNIYLDNSKLTWAIENSPNPFRGDKHRPPFYSQTIIVSNYIHLGYEGTLEIRFYNNRLMETDFYPLHFESYLDELTGSHSIQLIIDNAISLDKNTYIAIYKRANREGLCVSWFDNRLKNEVAEWIKRYS